MVRELRAGKVGGIFVSALDRAGRNVVELLQLLEACADFDTLFVPHGEPIDLTNPDQFAAQGMSAISAGTEIGKIRRRMRQGILGRLGYGWATSRPPAGYEITSKGKWGLDSDPGAQASIRTAFHTILTVRSFTKAARALREQGVLLPRRVRERDEAGKLPEVDDGVRVLRWAPATEHALLIMAKNRNYTGDYLYGRLRVDPRLGRAPNGKRRKRRAAEDELHIIPNHHPGRITSEQFAELQHIIEINRPSPERRNMGCGRALLEGALVRCEMHRNHVMRVSYQVDRKNRPRWWYCICDGESLVGGDGCGHVPGAVLEPVVSRALLDRLNTPSIEELRTHWEAARITEGDDEYRREAELACAQEEVKKAKCRSLGVDREKNPQVAEEYEALWEEAKTRLKKLESLAALPRTALSLFPDESWTEVLALSAERQALWDEQTTTVRDKKELVRTLLKAVIMESLGHDSVRRGHILWQDGAPATLFELPTRDSVRNRILQLAAEGLRPREIAERLNQLGVRNLQGHPWLAETVTNRIKKYQLREARRADRAA